MPSRRLTGLLASLLLLHLVLVGTDLPCSRHSHEVAVAPAEVAGADHGEHGDADGEPSAPDCDVPVRPECCEVFATCTVTLGLTHDVRPDLALSRDAVAAISLRAPSLSAPAPELPPPRA